MQAIALEAGNLAVELISCSKPSLKPDKSVITKADLAISKLVNEKLQELLKSDEHLLIDEEDKNNTDYHDIELLKKKKYIWSLDPIDGTRAFANQMPNFGVSLGLLKDLKPWMGIVYMPLLKQVFFSDGDKAYFIEGDCFVNGELNHEKKQEIKVIDQEITSQSIFLGTDRFVRTYHWESNDCHLMNPSAAIICLCWPAIARGCGSFFDAHIWDLAASWSIFKAAGLALRDIDNAEELSYLDPEKFKAESWKLKKGHILSSERNFPLLLKKISKYISPMIES